ncbi:peptidoglycan-binding domain-containing protein [Streptomyces phaeochromogenes]
MEALMRYKKTMIGMALFGTLGGCVVIAAESSHGSQAQAAVLNVAAAGAQERCARAWREGDSGSCVSALQESLKAHGATSLPVTGAFGPLTRRAVQDFQRTAGLTADGVAGRLTRQALDSGGPPLPLPPPALPRHPSPRCIATHRPSSLSKPQPGVSLTPLSLRRIRIK